ncbi:MAG TPA: sulfotransferase [Terriglobales bacterium]
MSAVEHNEDADCNTAPIRQTESSKLVPELTSRSSRTSMRSLPSFLLVGPPRTGTSWLHDILGSHVVLPNPTKETRFFDTHFHRGIDWYKAHFPQSDENQNMGEIAPTYFASNEARERIAATIPDAKIVCTFRNPVERVLSLYRVKRAYGMIPWSFDQAIVKDPELLESGRYATNLKAWQHTFGHDQILATVYEDLRDEPQSYLDKLTDFIGIPRFKLSPSQAGRVHASESMTHPKNYYRTRGATVMAEWFKARRLDKVVVAVKRSPLIKLFLGGGPPFTDLSRDTTLRLYERFLPEVEELESMMKRDFSAWKAGVNDAIAI